jgi:hypothetical protein
MCFFAESVKLGANSVVGDDFSHPITQLHLGNKKSKKVILVYISPTCLHCGKFLIEDIDEFMKRDKNDADIIIKFLPISAKDIFVMKLIQSEAKSENEYLLIFTNYMKRVLATINYSNPTQEQIKLFKGSKIDSEMIKFQVIASDFGFSNAKIVNSTPNMSAPFEKRLVEYYTSEAKSISKILKANELDLPLIIKSGELYKNLEEAENG